MIADARVDERGVGVLLDGCGRRVVHLRLSVTSECDLRCAYCRPAGGRVYRCANEWSNRQRAELVRFLHARYGLTHVRLTGGEPLVSPELTALVAELREAVPGLSIAMTTNGRLLAPLARDLRRAGLDRLNVSVDSLDPDRYRRITGGRLEDVLHGIEAAAMAGFGPPKINTVVLRGENETELTAMVRWAVERGCEVRFLEVMPIGPAAAANRAAFVSMADVRRRIAQQFPMTSMATDRGGTATRWRVRVGARDGVVGFIAPVTEPFCADCRRMRVTADGHLYPCLLDDRHVDLTSAWSGGAFDGARVGQLIEQTVREKAPSGTKQGTPMVQLGG